MQAELAANRAAWECQTTQSGLLLLEQAVLPGGGEEGGPAWLAVRQTPGPACHLCGGVVGEGQRVVSV